MIDNKCLIHNTEYSSDGACEECYLENAEKQAPILNEKIEQAIKMINNIEV